ncbi:MAG: LysE family translocator [Pseudomonadota bacterium]
MTLVQTLLPLWAFIVVVVATPGPANMLAMAVGARVGFWRFQRFNAGLIVGKILLNLAMALGMLTVLYDRPTLALIFKFASAGYMIYLAVRGWSAVPDPSDGSVGPVSFGAGLLVHPLNPKAWVMSVLAFTDYGPTLGADSGTPAFQAGIIITSFVLAQLIFHSGWCLAGVALARAVPASLWLHRGLTIVTVVVILIVLAV